MSSVVKIDYERYEGARALSEQSGIPITRIINDLIGYGLQHVEIDCVPTYRYKLSFDGKALSEGEDE